MKSPRSSLPACSSSRATLSGIDTSDAPVSSTKVTVTASLMRPGDQIAAAGMLLELDRLGGGGVGEQRPEHRQKQRERRQEAPHRPPHLLHSAVFTLHCAPALRRFWQFSSGGFFGLLALRPRRAAPDLPVLGRRDRAALAGLGAEDDLALVRGATLQSGFLGRLFVRFVPAGAVFAGRLVIGEGAERGLGRRGAGDQRQSGEAHGASGIAIGTILIPKRMVLLAEG